MIVMNIRPTLLIAAAAALLAAGMAHAQNGISALKGHDSKAPIDLAADRAEAQDRADRAIFAGNVVVKQGDRQVVAAAFGRHRPHELPALDPGTEDDERHDAGENDLRQVTEIARQMVLRWGMSAKLGPISFVAPQDDGLPPAFQQQPYSEADVKFMSGMIPHHAQAVLIAGWPVTLNSDVNGVNAFCASKSAAGSTPAMKSCARRSSTPSL